MIQRVGSFFLVRVTQILVERKMEIPFWLNTPGIKWEYSKTRLARIVLYRANKLDSAYPFGQVMQTVNYSVSYCQGHVNLFD